MVPSLLSENIDILNSSFSIDNFSENHLFDSKVGAIIIFSIDLVDWKLHEKSTSIELEEVTSTEIDQSDFFDREEILRIWPLASGLTPTEVRKDSSNKYF